MGTAPEKYRALSSIERRGLADFLETLTDNEWSQPSLCEGWRIKEAAAHVTMPFRISVPQLFVKILKAGGNFNKAADRLARGDAAQFTTSEIVNFIRDNHDNPFRPPGGGPSGALSHDVIHSLDITEALGAPRTPSVEAMTETASGFTAIQLKGLGFNPKLVKFVATDADVTIGEGPVVELPLKDLLLRVTGRKLPVT